MLLRLLLKVVDGDRGELHVGGAFTSGIAGLAGLTGVCEVELLVGMEDRLLVRWYTELGKRLLLGSVAYETRMRLELVTAVG